MHHPAFVFERPLHGLFERGFGVAPGCGERFCDRLGPTERKLKEVLEIDHPARAGASKIDLLGSEGREDEKLVPCTRYGDVQSAVAALAVERGDLRGDATGLVGPNGDRED